MSTYRPMVSIIIPSFNQGAFIAETIRSCLDQDYRPMEVIVIDGASTDNTVKVLTSLSGAPELVWISEPDRGVADAVNKGLRRANGSICAIQSSDDGFLPGAVSQAVAAFTRHPQAALIYADTIKVDVNGKETSRFATGSFSISRFLSKQTVVLQPSAFFRREAFHAVGGWSSDVFNADTECWLRMIMRYPAVKIDAFWAFRRMHAEQRDQQRDRILHDYERMMTEHPDLLDGPWSWRRAARCGLIRHSLRYGSINDPAGRRRALWRAVRAWPPVLFDPEVAGCLIPLFHAVRRRWPGRKGGG